MSNTGLRIGASNGTTSSHQHCSLHIRWGESGRGVRLGGNYVSRGRWFGRKNPKYYFVSGGSVTNAILASRMDLRSADAETFDECARSPSLHPKWQRSLWFTNCKSLRRSPLPGELNGSNNRRVGLAFQGYAVVESYRGAIALVAILIRGSHRNTKLDRVLRTATRYSPRLADCSGGTDHVFCATDLISATPVYFTTLRNGELHNTAVGWRSMSCIRLRRVVAASAAYPFALPAVRISKRRVQARSC